MIALRGYLKRREGQSYLTALEGGGRAGALDWMQLNYLGSWRAKERRAQYRSYASYESWKLHGELPDKGDSTVVVADQPRSFPVEHHCQPGLQLLPPDDAYELPGDDMECAVQSVVLISPDTKYLTMRVRGEMVLEAKRNKTPHRVEAFFERGAKPALVYRAFRAPGARLPLHYIMEAHGWGRMEGTVDGSCWHRLPMRRGGRALSVAFHVGTIIDWTSLHTGSLASPQCQLVDPERGALATGETGDPGHAESQPRWMSLSGTLYPRGEHWALSADPIAAVSEPTWSTEVESSTQVRVELITADGSVDPEGHVGVVLTSNSDPSCIDDQCDFRPASGLPLYTDFGYLTALFAPGPKSEQVRVLVQDREVATLSLLAPQCVEESREEPVPLRAVRPSADALPLMPPPKPGRSSANNHPPSVKVLHPVPGHAIEGWNFNVRWEGSDPDDDVLTYLLEVSVDGGKRWRVMAAGLQQEHLRLSTRDIAGSDATLIRIHASDGIETTSATTPAFTIVDGPL